MINFIDDDPDLNDDEGKTALHYAAMEGNLEKVKKLLEDGANINAQDKFGGTVLYYATLISRTEVIKELLARGADINIRNMEGETALYDAVREGNIEIVKELLAGGTDVNIQDKYGRTVLYYAITDNCIEVGKMLIAAGAKIPEGMVLQDELRELVQDPEEMLKQGKKQLKELKENLCQVLGGSDLPYTKRYVERIYENIISDASLKFKDIIILRDDFAKLLRRAYGLKFINTHPLSRLVQKSISRLNNLEARFNQRLANFKLEKGILELDEKTGMYKEVNYPGDLKNWENRTIVRLNGLRSIPTDSLIYRFVSTDTFLNFPNLAEEESKSREKRTQEVEDEFDSELEREEDTDKKKLIRERMEKVVDYKVKTDLADHFEEQYYKGLSKPYGVRLAKYLEKEWDNRDHRIQWSYQHDRFKKVDMEKAEERLNRWVDEVIKFERRKFEEFFKELENRYKSTERTL